MLCHQVPYTDFPSTFPVGHLLGIYYAFALFGVSFHSIVLFTIGFVILTFLWNYWLLRNLRLNRALALILAFATEATSPFVTSYWAFDPVTAVAGITFFLSAVWFLVAPTERRAQASYLAALLMIALAKPNVGVVLIIGSTVVFITSARHRWKVLVISIISFLCFLAILALHGISLFAMLANYSAVAGRLLSTEYAFSHGSDLSTDLSSAFTVLVLFLPFLLSTRGLESLFAGGRLQMICIIGALSSLYAFITNCDFKLYNTLLPLLATYFYSASVPSLKPAAGGLFPRFYFEKYMGCVALGAAIIGMGDGISRACIYGIGPFFEFTTPKDQVQIPFFDGFTGSPSFKAITEKTARIMKAYPNATVCFGPRMQWGYAAFNRPSPLHQPAWWNPYAGYNAADEPKIFHDLEGFNFDIIILFKGDATYWPPDYINYIKANYAADVSFDPATLLLRKKLH